MNKNNRYKMDEKTFKSWSKTHRMGRFKFTLIALAMNIIIGNIVCNLVKNIIDDSMIMLTFRQVITTSIFFAILGMFDSTLIWKLGEKHYYNYINQYNNNNL